MYFTKDLSGKTLQITIVHMILSIFATVNLLIYHAQLVFNFNLKEINSFLIERKSYSFKTLMTKYKIYNDKIIE